MLYHTKPSSCLFGVSNLTNVPVTESAVDIREKLSIFKTRGCFLWTKCHHSGGTLSVNLQINSDHYLMADILSHTSLLKVQRGANEPLQMIIATGSLMNHYLFLPE